jgi:hypothetical protein
MIFRRDFPGKVIAAGFLSVFSLMTFAQKPEIGVGLSVNFPFIPAVHSADDTDVPSGSGFSTMYYNYNYTETFDGHAGGKANLFVLLNLKKNFFLQTGIGLNLVRFKRNVIIENPAGNIIHDTTGFTIITGNNGFTVPGGETAILYTEIPVLAGYRFFHRHLDVACGFAASWVTYSEQTKPTYSYIGQGGISGSETNDKSSDGLTNFNISAQLEATYILLQKILFFCRGSVQLNPIYDKSARYAGKTGVVLIETGFGYRFY